MIPFNKPHLTGKEAYYTNDAINTGKLSGNGKYTKLCQEFFETKYGFKKTLLTTSCTDALEMCAMLIDIKSGDEVIVPSYTFVSSALAFVRQGAKIVFADSRANHPNIDVEAIKNKITAKTKVIVCVHYSGISVDMDEILHLAKKHNIFIVEDAAQSIDSFYKGKPLGTIGHLSAFSFHETKNIISGEGGLLGINDKRFIERAEVIWEKGTNRASFFRGEVNKYGWQDTGSSFLPSELIAAFLYAQLENLNKIQKRRKFIWNCYNNAFQSIKFKTKLPHLPNYSTNNAHMYYLVLTNLEQKTKFINYCKENNIQCVSHYMSLHMSNYYKSKNIDIPKLPNSDMFMNCLVRLPLYYDMTDDEIKKVTLTVQNFF